MSLLNRLGSARHLDDAVLADLWTAETAGGQVTDAGHDAWRAHLASCAHCRARYSAFGDWLDRLRDDAHAEADEAFPAERLGMQQTQILRRLEALERPARVLAFPRFSRPTTSTQGNAQRWVAAAAAAGLVIGLAAGQFVDIRHTFGRPMPSSPNTSARLRPPTTDTELPAAPTARSSVSDETLFFGSDAAPNVVPISTLQAMDAITPLARDFDQPQ